MIFNSELFYQHPHPPPSNPCLKPTNPRLRLRSGRERLRERDKDVRRECVRQFWETEEDPLATPAAPSETAIKKTRRSPIAAARDHVNSHSGTLHDKLAKIVVRCAADFMTRRQNLHYKIASQQKLKTDKEYIPSQLRSNWSFL